MAARDAAAIKRSRQKRAITTLVHQRANRATLNKLRYRDTELWDQQWAVQRQIWIAEGYSGQQLHAKCRNGMTKWYRANFPEDWATYLHEYVEYFRTELGWEDARKKEFAEKHGVVQGRPKKDG
jgi:hypothetical protein